MQAHIVCDLGFGDSGKGSWTDYLCRKTGAGLVVRYNGGAQAGHNVHLPDGRHHTFHQWGSGTLAGVSTLLSQYMLVNPMALPLEALKLQALGIKDPYSELYIDGRAKITTPYHVAVNRLREWDRGDGRHGSCGMGIGETVDFDIQDSESTIYAADLKDRGLLAQKWERQFYMTKDRVGDIVYRVREGDKPASRSIVWSANSFYNDPEQKEAFDVFLEIAKSLKILDQRGVGALLGNSRNLVFEGAQGVLLDETYGFAPHTTWSNTTPENAHAILKEAGYPGKVITHGVIRAYMTRHGNGPLPTESRYAKFTEDDNPTNEWQGDFRAGWLDIPLLRYVLSVAPVNDLLVSCLDQLCSICQVCVVYKGKEKGFVPTAENLGDAVPIFINSPQNTRKHAMFIARELNLPLAGASFGPTHEDKLWYEHGSTLTESDLLDMPERWPGLIVPPGGHDA